jgi:hypothetical protein
MKSKKQIDWSEAEKRARASLNRSKSAIEATAFGTPADWSRPTYNKPLIAPDPSAPDTHIKSRIINKKQRKKQYKKFSLEQRRKSRISTENNGLPIVSTSLSIEEREWIKSWKENHKK